MALIINEEQQMLKTSTKEFLDFVYIDGNHMSKYVLEDAVNAFYCLKNNGYIIFDQSTNAYLLNTPNNNSPNKILTNINNNYYISGTTILNNTTSCLSNIISKNINVDTSRTKREMKIFLIGFIKNSF